MIHAQLTGTLTSKPEPKTAKNEKHYCHLFVTVKIDDKSHTIFCVAFEAGIVESIGNLDKGDPISVLGHLKPSTWKDKATGQDKSGWQLLITKFLSLHDIGKAIPKT